MPCAKLENRARKKIFRAEKKLIYGSIFVAFSTKISPKSKSAPKFYAGAPKNAENLKRKKMPTELFA
jgi:hypothetical protein